MAQEAPTETPSDVSLGAARGADVAPEIASFCGSLPGAGLGEALTRA